MEFITCVPVSPEIVPSLRKCMLSCLVGTACESVNLFSIEPVVTLNGGLYAMPIPGNSTNHQNSNIGGVIQSRRQGSMLTAQRSLRL